MILPRLESNLNFKFKVNFTRSKFKLAGSSRSKFKLDSDSESDGLAALG